MATPPARKGSRLEANHAFLKAHASAETVAEIVAATADSPFPLQVTESRRGNHPFDFAIAGPDGREVVFHSRRDPVGEAERKVGRWLEDHAVSEDAVIVAFAMASPFHFQALSRHLGQDQQLVLVDTRPELVAAALPYVDLTSLAEGTCVIVSRDVNRIWSELRLILGENSPRTYHGYLDSGIARALPNEYQEAGERLAWYAQMNWSSAQCRSVFEREWLEHSLLNMHAMLRSSPVDRLDSLFAGTPAVIVASGPSLDRHTETIRALQPHAIVIAVSSAIRPLVRSGIRPDFAVFLDSRPQTRKQLQELSDSELEETFLVAPISIQPINLSRFPGRRFLTWVLSTTGVRRILEEFGVDGGFYGGGTTVAISAVQLARFLGCDTGFAFGLDLSMGADKQQYCGNTFHKKDAPEKPKRALMEVPGNWDETVWTTPTMAGFIGEIGLFLESTLDSDRPIRLRNVNDAGARITALPAIRQNDIETADLPPIENKLNRIRDCAVPEYLPDDASAATALEAVVSRLRAAGKSAARAATICSSLLTPSGNDDALLSELKALGHELQADETISLLLEDALAAEGQGVPTAREDLSSIAEAYKTTATNAAWLAERVEASAHGGGPPPGPA